MTTLKIDGLRDATAAVAAAQAGADLIGFVFVPGARRRLPVDDARAIIEEYRRQRGDGGPRLVGLFADQPIDLVESVVGECGLDVAQLCGSESPEQWRQLSVPVIKQIKVRDDRPLEQAIEETRSRVEEVVSLGQTATLDKYREGSQGGTGHAFDWSIAEALTGSYDFFLAGGLTPENVREAMERVRPWGVDVSSGVETDGVKDVRKIAAFAAEVRRADESLLRSEGAEGPPR